MPKKINAELAKSIDDLATKGYSENIIAQKTGLTRDAVAQYLYKDTNIGELRYPSMATPSAFNTKRCPKCGAKVKMPCFECKIQEIKERKNERTNCVGRI